MIRVLLADDHPTLRVGLKVLLEQAPDIEVVGEAHTGPEALAQIEELRPDVVVLDCKLPGLSGPQIAALIRQKNLPVRVLMLSAYTDDHYVYGALDAGAVGYVLKSEAPQVIVEAVRKAARGESYFSPPVAAKVGEWARGERPGELTERELEVLRLVSEGLSNKEIARRLKVKERTVEFHLGNILRKLGVASRVEAAVWAKERGIF